MTRVHRPDASDFVIRGDTFSGTVFSSRRESDIPGVRVTSVLFTAGSHTYWHRHEGGQILIVTAGAGQLGTRDGDLINISAGSVVVSPPGVEHFHGALGNSPMVHEAISFGSTYWLEEVV